MQGLPDHGLLIADRSARDPRLRATERDRPIITLPGVTTDPLPLAAAPRPSGTAVSAGP